MPWRSPIPSDNNGTTALQRSFPLAKAHEEIGAALTFLGTIEEIWRYPVSSLGGEKLTSVEIDETGIVGDRQWCIADAQLGEVAMPEKQERWRPALFLNSRLTDNSAEIGFPDGCWLDVCDDSIDAKLAQHFGFETTLLAYENTGVRDPSVRGIGVNRYEPSPLHLITTSSLDQLSNLLGNETVDSRRFRPNVVLRTEGQAEFREKAWIGQRLELGSSVTIEASEETKRCGMTLIAQPDIHENADILRTILRQNKRNFGIYASVEKTGAITLGDSVHLQDV